MDKNVEAFMEGIIAKNPGENEFHQAVREVAELILKSQGKWQEMLQLYQS